MKEVEEKRLAPQPLFERIFVRAFESVHQKVSDATFLANAALLLLDPEGLEEQHRTRKSREGFGQHGRAASGERTQDENEQRILLGAHGTSSALIEPQGAVVFLLQIPLSITSVPLAS